MGSIWDCSLLFGRLQLSNSWFNRLSPHSLPLQNQFQNQGQWKNCFNESKSRCFDGDSISLTNTLQSHWLYHCSKYLNTFLAVKTCLEITKQSRKHDVNCSTVGKQLNLAKTNRIPLANKKVLTWVLIMLNIRWRKLAFMTKHIKIVHSTL